MLAESEVVCLPAVADRVPEVPDVPGVPGGAVELMEALADFIRVLSNGKLAAVLVYVLHAMRPLIIATTCRSDKKRYL